MEPIIPAEVYTQISLPIFRLWVAGLLLLVALPSAIVLGYYAGRSSRRRQDAAGKLPDLKTGESTVGAFLALLGLLLAFSFGNVLLESQTDKSLLIAEAASLSTVFARSDMLPEPGRTELKKAILAYARTRITTDDGGVSTVEEAHEFIEESMRAQEILWPLALKHTGDPLPPAVRVSFVSAMNDALDAHLFRMQMLSTPVSGYVQAMVFSAALAALFLVGNRFGFTNRTLTWRTLVYAGFLWAVMMTIADTQRSDEGLIRVDDSALRATVAEMENGLNF